MYPFPDEEQIENIGESIGELLYNIYIYIYKLLHTIYDLIPIIRIR